MSATDELRRMLNERGVAKGRLEYSPSKGVSVTAWDLEDGEFPREKEASFTEFEDGVTLVRIWNITPEQAITATLGSGTCHKVRVHMQIEDEMHCSECGRFLGFAGDAGAPPCNYCPNCGRKVVDE